MALKKKKNRHLQAIGVLGRQARHENNLQRLKQGREYVSSNNRVKHNTEETTPDSVPIMKQKIEEALKGKSLY
jgi:hypothetical protein